MSSNRDKADNTTKPKNSRKSLAEMPLDVWAEESTNKECVRFYKSKGILSHKYPQLRSDGFVLLIMTKPQISILKKLCDKLVCIDHQKGEKFEVITLNVIDELGHSFPCGSVFIDKVDRVVVEVFFTEIKSVIGSVSVKLLMSGKDEFIPDTWSRVIGPPSEKMLCSWEVLRDWKSKLHLIPSKVKQSDVFKKMRTMLNESDKDIFIGNFNSLVSDLSSDPESAQFAVYIVENFSENPSFWAPCFVFDEGSKVNYQLEIMHWTFKQVLQDKGTRRLDRALNNILELVRKRTFDRLLLISRDKQVTYNLVLKHNLSQKYTFIVTKKSSYWDVSTLTGKKVEKHRIRFGDKDCQCPHKCRICEVCYHVYTCSCPDSNVRLNMCRHIHGLCMNQAAGTVTENPTDDSEESDMETEDQEQLQSLENFFSIGQEVDVGNQEMYGDDVLAQFDTNYVGEAEITVDQYDPHQNGEIQPFPTQIREEVQSTYRSASESLSIELRKLRVENLFKRVLNNVSHDHQLQEIEKTLYILQDRIQGVKSCKKSIKRSSQKGQVQHNIQHTKKPRQ